MKTLFIISITALVVTAGIVAFGYIEIQKLKEINEVNYYYSFKLSQHKAEWNDYYFEHYDQVSQKTLMKMFSKYTTEERQLEHEWLNKINKLL